jgi:hypothetical protein
LAVAQLPAIKLKWNAQRAKANHFAPLRSASSLAVARSHPFVLSCLLASRSAVALSDRNTATRKAKKSFLCAEVHNAFLALLGVFITNYCLSKKHFMFLCSFF